ncbi:MAG: M81 family metallopeptidase [Firmicutes bacterium]|nr:M81 family metallopeptidase [Bacillota bacterium]MCL5065744.1 M81 family metallopeptidase [Bacillota bacterium]
MAAWRVGIAEIMQESNTFCAQASSWEELLGERSDPTMVLTAALTQGDNEVAGLLGGLTDTGLPLEIVPMVQLSALAAGPLTPAVYQRLIAVWEDFLQRARPLDALVLALHGALVAIDDDDVDGTILAMARRFLGHPAIIGATLDLHALVTPQMVSCANILVGYRTYPHVDQRETGYRVGALVGQALHAGRQPRTFVARRPFLIPPDGANTAIEPMVRWQTAARTMESHAGVLSASCFAVQPWLDVPELASGATLVVDSQVTSASAQEWVETLANVGWDHRRGFASDRMDPTIAVAEALKEPEGPVILADLGDGTAGGGLGDSTVLLDLLVQRDPRMPCIVPLVDPEAVAKCWKIGAGQGLCQSVGGGLHPQWYRPVVLKGLVVRLWEGECILSGPYFRGRTMVVGKTAVWQIGQVTVLLLERPVLTSDPALFRAVGLEPVDYQVIVVKSPQLFRAAFESLAHRVLLADTPGPTDHHLERLPFVRARRPLFPLDP